MSRKPHLDLEQLLDYLESPLAAERRKLTRAHLDACPRCRTELKRAEEILDLIRSDRAGDAPDLWIHRAIHRAVPRWDSAALIGSHDAEIVFDSAGAAVRSGVRQAGAAGRHLLLAAEAVEVELRIASRDSKDRWPLTGRIFDIQGAIERLGGLTVSVREGSKHTAETRTTELGEFLLDRRPSRPFKIMIAGESWRIASPLIDPET